ncbi:uncharacterized protein LOC111704370 isoform X2 [Eurytemora carolleeae]|nr:uncharacterized protein LOC111704370 isoform X2 [Eurytemora carolleeae]|eukprot:XP_023332365.1 uncharacterized protein LOC111704370 isoform X2 [Eurytemora affinis]
MASNNFRGGPILMIIASSCSIGFSILSIALIFEKKRNLYAMFSVLGCIVFCIQLAALILAFILRNNIQTDLNKVNVERQLEMAVSDNSTMETWSSLQTRYSCCGGRGASGYREWEKYLLSSYPDSCCTVPYPDCGIQAKRPLDTDFTQKIYERIHVKGCITTIKESWDTYVMPLLLAWGLIGIVVALCELFLILSCVLFSYHLSTSTRRTRTSSTAGDCPVHGQRKVSAVSTQTGVVRKLSELSEKNRKMSEFVTEKHRLAAKEENDEKNDNVSPSDEQTRRKSSPLEDKNGRKNSPLEDKNGKKRSPLTEEKKMSREKKNQENGLCNNTLIIENMKNERNNRKTGKVQRNSVKNDSLS